MKARDIQIKDEYLDLIPRLTSSERRSLKFSIQDDHQLVPIVVNEKGFILDGHTRFDICQELQRIPRFIIKKFKSEYDEKKFIIMSNIARRQLNKFQKIEMAWDLYDIEKERAHKREYWKLYYKTPPKAIGNAMEVFGKYMDTGHTTIHQVEWLRNNSSKKTLKQLREGTISITKAYDLEKGINLITRVEVQHWYCECKQPNVKSRKTCLNCGKKRSRPSPNYCPECNSITVLWDKRGAGKKRCHVHKNRCCSRCKWGE